MKCETCKYWKEIKDREHGICYNKEVKEEVALPLAPTKNFGCIYGTDQI